jgi:hypothetical protein
MLKPTMCSPRFSCLFILTFQKGWGIRIRGHEVRPVGYSISDPL